jgi:sensor histidine kinase regulating citrate/malate metabolism
MFRILSDDIYEGDPYVFLRELLQNAIDAVRTRRAQLSQAEKSAAKRKMSDARFDTTIYFTAQHQQNGDIHVTCRDNGIGMDEHVIRNYFSVAGVSYRSLGSESAFSVALWSPTVSKCGLIAIRCVEHRWPNHTHTEVKSTSRGGFMFEYRL